MIILKSYLRSKLSKIFVMVFIPILTCLFILISFSSYYSNYIVDVYKRNSYFLINSEKNIYDKLHDIKEIVDIERVILFDSAFDEKSNNISNYLIDIGNDKIIGLSTDKEETIFLANESYRTLKNKNKIILKKDNINIDYNAYFVKQSYFTRILVNEEEFNKIYNENESNNYIFSLNNYDNIENVNNDLYKINSVKKVKFITSVESEKEINTVNELKNVIVILNYFIILFSIIFVLLLIIIIKTTINEEIDKMYIERYIGFNKYQIKKHTFINIVFISTLTILITVIIYFILIKLIRSIFDILLPLINISNFIYTYLIIVGVMFIFILFKRINAIVKK